MTNKKTEILSFRLDPLTRLDFEELCEKAGIPMSLAVSILIKNAVKENTIIKI